jgi:pilus assembly protein Flp/PilA
MHIVLFRFLFDESGATAIEYALVATGIALAIVAAVSSLGTSLGSKFDGISTAMQ